MQAGKIIYLSTEIKMKKKRILSGAQPSGLLHIGNYFGMIRRMIDFQDSSDLFCFIANYHSLTSISNKEELEKNTFNAFSDLLALGLDSKKIYCMGSISCSSSYRINMDTIQFYKRRFNAEINIIQG